MYVEDVVIGAVMSTPNIQWWATSQIAHRCLELPLMCPLMMPLMRAAVMKVSMCIHQLLKLSDLLPNS